MKIIEKLNQFKVVIGFAILILGIPGIFVGYIGKVVAEETQLMKAQQTLIHDNFYQNSRIYRKEIEIQENERELESIEEYIGELKPTPRQIRKLNFLESENIRLNKEIEKIRVVMNKSLVGKDG